MSAIERCRTAALGGHVEQCDACGHQRIAFNSCRNRHCPKCQSLVRAQWLEDRQADLLPVEYFHVVFTLPEEIAAIAYQNKAVVYDILFHATAETLRTIAADPKHLGAEIGFIAILHTWGQNLLHHPHLHCVVPGGGICARWRALDLLPAGILSAGAGAVATVSPAVPGAVAARPLRRASCTSSTPWPGCRTPRPSPASGSGRQSRVGGLRQAAIRGPAAGPRVSGSLHASGGHRQQPADRFVDGKVSLSLEGLPPRLAPRR